MKKNKVKISFDKSKAAFIEMLSHSLIRSKILTLLMLSAKELYDTSKKKFFKNLEVNIEFSGK